MSFETLMISFDRSRQNQNQKLLNFPIKMIIEFSLDSFLIDKFNLTEIENEILSTIIGSFRNLIYFVYDLLKRILNKISIYSTEHSNGLSISLCVLIFDLNFLFFIYK